MKFSTDTDVSTFVPEQQDALLAEMQGEALRDFQSAASLADRASATAAFAQAAKARTRLYPIVAARRAHKERFAPHPAA
jgi:hypothetical protein